VGGVEGFVDDRGRGRGLLGDGVDGALEEVALLSCYFYLTTVPSRGRDLRDELRSCPDCQTWDDMKVLIEAHNVLDAPPLTSRYVY
jgi:hypothetical protein